MTPWGEDAVLIQGDERPQGVRRELLGEQDARGAVALHHAMGGERWGGALGEDLLQGLAEGERLGLGEDVGHEQVVVATQGVEGPAKRSGRVGRGGCPGGSVDRSCAARGAWLSPVDRACIKIDRQAIEGDVLSV